MLAIHSINIITKVKWNTDELIIIEIVVDSVKWWLSREVNFEDDAVHCDEIKLNVFGLQPRTRNTHHMMVVKAQNCLRENLSPSRRNKEED